MNRKVGNKTRKAKKYNSNKIQINTSKHITDSMSTAWEKEIHYKLQTSKFESELLFRKFPLQTKDGKLFNYIPKFVLNRCDDNGKRVIIEVCEFMSEDIAFKHGLFMQKYQKQYHMIMIVSDNELRKWNNWEQNSPYIIYDEIWTIDDLDDLLNSLKNFKLISNKKIQHAKKPSTLINDEQHRNVKCIGCKIIFKTNKNALYCKMCKNKF